MLPPYMHSQCTNLRHGMQVCTNIWQSPLALGAAGTPSPSPQLDPGLHPPVIVYNVAPTKKCAFDVSACSGVCGISLEDVRSLLCKSFAKLAADFGSWKLTVCIMLAM